MEPLREPPPAGPDYVWAPDMEQPLSPAQYVGRKIADLARKPAHWIRENIVEANRGPKYYWYHRKYERALPIDECFMDDNACIYEANLDYKRNLLVDRQTLEILKFRKDSCQLWNYTTKNSAEPSDKCKDVVDTYLREEVNFFIKYGDMSYNHNVVASFNKQKHRMIMERRVALRNQKEENS